MMGCGSFLFLVGYLVLFALIFLIGIEASTKDDKLFTDILVVLLGRSEVVRLYGRDLSLQITIIAKYMDQFLSSKFNEMLLESAALFFTAVFYSKVRNCLSRCSGNRHPEEAEEATRVLMALKYERMNVTLHILEEGKWPWGEKYPERYDNKEEVAIGRPHKIHMRTLHEGPLVGAHGCFGGEQEPWVVKKMLKDNKPWNDQNGDVMKVAPFLTTHVLKGLHESDQISIAKQMTDQVINRISMLFRGAHIAQDQGCHVSSCEYVFGLTYEKPDPLKRTNQKVRCLLMRKKSLERLNEEWNCKAGGDPLRFCPMNEYGRRRCMDLLTLHSLWKRRSNIFASEDANRAVLVGRLFISVQGNS